MAAPESRWRKGSQSRELERLDLASDAGGEATGKPSHARPKCWENGEQTRKEE